MLRRLLLLSFAAALVALAGAAPSQAAGKRTCATTDAYDVRTRDGMTLFSRVSAQGRTRWNLCRRGTPAMKVVGRENVSLLHVRGVHALYLTWDEDAEETDEVRPYWLQLVDLGARRQVRVARLVRRVGRRETALGGKGVAYFRDFEGALSRMSLDRYREDVDWSADSTTSGIRVSGSGPTERVTYNGRTIALAERRAELDRCFAEDGYDDLVFQQDGVGFVGRRDADYGVIACTPDQGKLVYLAYGCGRFRADWRGTLLAFACGSVVPTVGVADMGQLKVLLSTPTNDSAFVIAERALAVSDFGAIAWADLPQPSGPNRPAEAVPPRRAIRLFAPGMSAPEIVGTAGYEVSDPRWDGRTLRWTAQEQQGGAEEPREHAVP